ncbi:hypothetical protein AB0I61_17340 [Polymorphospora rubra]|uniref:hypothetical protein n=1 Tax=Polymorphospora rubra TaxID=338584 RepID=UPI0033FF7BEE
MPRLPAWFVDTITVIRAGTRTDRLGDEVPDWDAATEHDVDRCKVNPATGAETSGPLDERAALSRRWILAAPPTADLLASDRVRWMGDVYEVDGEVLPWRSPHGGVDHLYAELTRWEG